MQLNEYQTETNNTAVYPYQGGSSGLQYVAIALAGEVGEFCNVLKKTIRDGVTPEKQAKMVDELGDVLWYVARAALELGVTLDQVAEVNLEKLRKRKADGKIHTDKAGER